MGGIREDRRIESPRETTGTPINVKLRTLADLYHLPHQDWLSSWMVVLEFTIVLLFAIDVLLFFLGW